MYMVETHNDIPRTVPQESGVDLVRPVRCASDKDVLLDVRAIHLCSEDPVASGSTVIRSPDTPSQKKSEKI